jgi:hypothetical protein
MPQPTLSAVHVNRPLTNISRAYLQQASNFIAPLVFPRVPVNNKSDLYYRYNKADFMRDEMRKRAPATESHGSGYNLDTATYNCDVWALHKDIDDQIRANYDAPLDAERDATQWLSQQSMIRLERQFAAQYFTTGVWGTDAVGGTDFIKWDDPASNPEVNISNARTVILQNTGQMPNTLTVSHEVHEALKRNPVVKDRFKYTSSDAITEQLLARFFEVDRYLVSRAVYTPSLEGDTTPTFNFAVGRNALLSYVNPTPSLMAPSAGYVFTWRGLLGGAGADLGTAVKRFRMEPLGSDRIEIEAAFDMHVVAADCGYFFSDAVDAAA